MAISVMSSSSDLDVHDLLDASEPAITISAGQHEHDVAGRRSRTAGPGSRGSSAPMNMTQRRPAASETTQRDMRPWAVSVRDQPPERDALADRVGHAVEHLGRVAARLALEGRDERDLVQVAVVHPLDRPCRATSRAARPAARPRPRAGTRASRGSGASSTATASAPAKLWPGAHRGGDHLQVVGELLAEQHALLRGAVRDEPAHAPRDQQREQGDPAAPLIAAKSHISEERGDDRQRARSAPAGARSARSRRPP